MDIRSTVPAPYETEHSVVKGGVAQAGAKAALAYRQ